jgi:hypothetical protein
MSTNEGEDIKNNIDGTRASIESLNSQLDTINSAINEKTTLLNNKQAELAAKQQQVDKTSSPGDTGGAGGAGDGSSDIASLTQDIANLTQEIQDLTQKKDKIDAEIKTSTIPTNPVSIIVPVESTGTGSNGTATATPNNKYSVEYDTKNKVANVTTPDGKNYLVGVALTLGKEPSISIVKPDATAAATQEIKKPAEEITPKSIQDGMDAYKKKLEVKLKTELGLDEDEDVKTCLTNIQQPNDKLLGDTYELIMRCGLLIKFLNTKLTASFLGKRSERKVPNANIKRALDALLDVYGIAATKEWLTVKNTSGLKKGDDKDKALPIDTTRSSDDIPKDDIYFTYLRELNGFLKLSFNDAEEAKNEASALYDKENALAIAVKKASDAVHDAEITLEGKTDVFNQASIEKIKQFKPAFTQAGAELVKDDNYKKFDAVAVEAAKKEQDKAIQELTDAKNAKKNAEAALTTAKEEDPTYMSTLQASYNAFIIEDTYLTKFNQSGSPNSNRFDGFITPFAQIIIESTLVFKSYTEANLKGAWLFNSANPVPRWTRSKIFTDTITTFQAHNDFLIYLNLYKHLLELKNRYEGKEDDPNADLNASTSTAIGGRSTRKEHRRYLKKENRRTNKKHRRSFRRK